MERKNKHYLYSEELLKRLDDEKLSEIDFDLLKEWLAEIMPVLKESAGLKEQLHLYREDCISRIGGMVKAIAVAEKHPDRLEEAITYVESLTELSANELINQYRKISAKFRDAFPASFGLALKRNTSYSGHKNLSVFK